MKAESKIGSLAPHAMSACDFKVRIYTYRIYTKVSRVGPNDFKQCMQQIWSKSHG